MTGAHIVPASHIARVYWNNLLQFRYFGLYCSWRHHIQNFLTLINCIHRRARWALRKKIINIIHNLSWRGRYLHRGRIVVAGILLKEIQGWLDSCHAVSRTLSTYIVWKLIKPHSTMAQRGIRYSTFIIRTITVGYAATGGLDCFRLISITAIFFTCIAHFRK